MGWGGLGWVGVGWGAWFGLGRLAWFGSRWIVVGCVGLRVRLHLSE